MYEEFVNCVSCQCVVLMGLEKLVHCGMFIREMSKKPFKSMMLSIADISPLVCTIIINITRCAN